MIRPMRHGSPPRLMALQSILSPNRRESLPTPSAGVRISSPIAAILLFSLGAFAHQMLSSLLYAVVTDVFPKQDVATATGFGGMAGYLGGTLSLPSVAAR